MQRAARLEPGGPQSQPQAGSEPKARAPTPRPPPWGRERISGASAGGSRWPGAAASRFDKPQPVRYNKKASTGRRKLHQWERPGAERLRVFSCAVSRNLPPTQRKTGGPLPLRGKPFPPGPPSRPARAWPPGVGPCGPGINAPQALRGKGGLLTGGPAQGQAAQSAGAAPALRSAANSPVYLLGGRCSAKKGPL